MNVSANVPGLLNRPCCPWTLLLQVLTEQQAHRCGRHSCCIAAPADETHYARTVPVAALPLLTPCFHAASSLHTGSLPDLSLGAFPKLEALYLENNALAGTLPGSWAGFPAIIYM